MLDPYKTLKISRDAPDEVIRAAYKVLASKYHPDKNPGNSASARLMQTINDAYALLSDPARRSAYDRSSMGGEQQRPEPPPPRPEQSPQRSVKITCRSCGKTLRVNDDVLTSPKFFRVRCPECGSDPRAEPAPPEPPPAKPSPEPLKSIVVCRHCGQSIRVSTAAVQRPELFDVACPNCGRHPLEGNARGYQQYTRTRRQSIASVVGSAVSRLLAATWRVIKLVVQTTALIAVVTFIVWLALRFGDTDNQQPPKPAAATHTPSYAAAPPAHPVAPVLRPVAPPYSGAVRQYARDLGIAPLEIRTAAGADYLIKVVDAYTNAAALDIYVRGGDTANVMVPLGKYNLRYATGRTWYGYAYLFGEETSYNQADSTLTFSDDGTQISGYTLTLYQVSNGNMRTNRIPASQF